MDIPLSSYLEAPGFLPFYPLFVAIALVLAYLCGSIPIALVVGRMVAGIDIRKHGSGNTGTANTLRVLGWGPGFLVFALDVLKGILGCFFMILALTRVGAILIDSAQLSATQSSGASFVAFGVAVTGFLHDIPIALAALACIAGHMFSPFMHFRGGKGVATALGVFLVLTPWAALLALTVFGVLALLSRIISIGSITAIISLPIFIALFNGNSPTYIVFGVLIMFVVLAAHRKNIVRILHNEEPRFSVGSLKKASGNNKALTLGENEDSSGEDKD